MVRFWHIFLAVALAASTGCTSSIKVRHVTIATPPDKYENGGVYYALPRTVITASVPVIQKKVKDGEYCACAAVLGTGQNSTCQDDKTNKPTTKLNYSLGTVTLGARGEPDPSQIYQVDITGHYFEDKTMTLNFTDDGILTHGEAQSTNHLVDVVVTTLGDAAKIAASALTPVKLAIAPVKGTCDQVTQTAANKVKDELDKMTAARDKILADSTDETLDVLQARLKPYQDKIDKDLSSFFGTTATATIWTAMYEVAPTKLFDSVLFKLDSANGVCVDTEPPATPAGDPTDTLRLLDRFEGTGDDKYPGVTKSCTGTITSVRLSTSAPEPSSIAAGIQAPTQHDDDTHGFFYRIPGIGTAAVYSIVPQGVGTSATIQLARQRTAIAQYGKTAWLPMSTGGKRTQYTIDLSATTGAMKNFIMASDAVLDKSMVDTLSTGATTVIDAQRQKEKAAQAAAAIKQVDDLKGQGDVLDQQKRILQLQQDIETLKKAQTTPQ